MGHVGFEKSGVPPTYEELAPRCGHFVKPRRCAVKLWNCPFGMCDVGGVLTWGEGKDVRLGYESAQEEARAWSKDLKAKILPPSLARTIAA